MKRILCITSSLEIGGAETFLMKVYRTLNKNEYQMDFLVSTTRKCAYDDEVRNYGGKIFSVISKEISPIKNFRGIIDVVRKNRYEHVIKVSEYSIGALDLLAAKIGGAKSLAFRSTNGGSLESNIKIAIHKVLIPFANYICTSRIAPSTEAARFTFGKRAVNRNDVKLLKNGVPLQDYTYNPDELQELKQTLEIDGKYVVGHIGRFSEQKNHRKILEIFKEFKDIRKDAVLLLVGDGELRTDIENEIIKNDLQDYVYMLGIRRDVPRILSIMDVILFPSFYEGMPNVIIEAQACGVPCVISDTITHEVDLTGLISCVSLDVPNKEWIEKLLCAKKKEINECHQLIAQKGYSMDDVAREFVALVCKGV